MAIGQFNYQLVFVIFEEMSNDFEILSGERVVRNGDLDALLVSVIQQLILSISV